MTNSLHQPSLSSSISIRFLISFMMRFIIQFFWEIKFGLLFLGAESEFSSRCLKYVYSGLPTLIFPSIVLINLILSYKLTSMSTVCSEFSSASVLSVNHFQDNLVLKFYYIIHQCLQSSFSLKICNIEKLLI